MALVAKSVLILAVISLAITSAYGALNYSHQVKWTFWNTGHGQSVSLAPGINGMVYSRAYADVELNEGPVNIYALSDDGRLQWTYSLYSNEGNDTHGYWGTTPIASHNGTVFFAGTLNGNDHPSLCALSPEGKITWSYPLDIGTSTSPKIYGNDTLYMIHRSLNNSTPSPYEFMAFSLGGQPLWHHSYNAPPEYVVANNGTVLIDGDDHNVTAYDRNGAVLWKMPFEPFSSDSVVHGNTMYFTNYTQEGDGLRTDLRAVSTTNGSLLWRYNGTTVEGGVRSLFAAYGAGSVVVDDRGNVYYVDWTGTSLEPHCSLVALDPNGTVCWEHKQVMFTGLTLAGANLVYMDSYDLIALDLDGHITWDTPLSNGLLDRALILNIGDTFYVPDADGLIAVGDNFSVLETGLLVLIPIIAACSAVVWWTGKGRAAHNSK